MITKKHRSWWISGALTAIVTVSAVLTYEVVSARNVATADEAAQSALHDPLNLTWPFGWTPLPTERAANRHNAIATAVFTVKGKKLATIVVLLDRFTKHRTLEDEVDQRIKSETRVAKQEGDDLAASPPVKDTWLGHPALRYDAIYGYRATNRRLHQRLIFTMGSDNIYCSVWYAASEEDFERYLADAERVRNQVTCP